MNNLSRKQWEDRYNELIGQPEKYTRTYARVLFLGELLGSGISKREAALTLSEIDPLLQRSSAETIVYSVFSGQYRTFKRRPRDTGEPIQKVDAPNDVEDDEGLL